MKLFIGVVILAYLSVSTADEQDGFQKGTLVDPPTNSTGGRQGRYFYVANPADTCKTSPAGTSYCTESNSCSPGGKVFTCTDSYGYTEPVACAEPTPYCTGNTGFGKCTAFPERTCETSLNYKCPGIGYFPDLYDCLTYYYCDYDSILKKLVPQQYSCNSGYPFSAEGKGGYNCAPKGACVVPKCSTFIAAEWVPLNYSGSPGTMAVYCLNGRPKYVYSCPPGLTINTYSLTNTASPYCEVQCTRDLLRAPFVSDNTRYYECRGGVAYQVLCPRGRVYDSYTETCIISPF
jgi:hypothetical protein